MFKATFATRTFLASALFLSLGTTTFAQPTVTQMSVDENARSLATTTIARYNSPGHLLSPGQRDATKAFFAQNLGPSGPNTKSLLYLFAGADVFYPPLLFPNMTKMLMIGLEPPVAPLNAAQLERSGQLAGKRNQITSALRSLFSHSYFITTHMATELREFGTATMIAVGLVTTGNRILFFTQVSVGTDGRLNENTSSGVPGFRFSYVKPNGENAELFYFQSDLSHLNSNPGLLLFLSSQQFDTAYYKAASFAPHSLAIRSINDFVVNTVRHVVQTDDGLPVRAFQGQSENWSLRLFGYYQRPYLGLIPFRHNPDPAGSSTFQPDLHAIYDVALSGSNHPAWQGLWRGQRFANNPIRFSSVKWERELPFAYGYNKNHPRFSNFMVFDRVR